MSILHVNQISTKIKELFASALDDSDLSDRDTERDVKVLTRCLAAYAIYNSNGCSEDEAASSVVDGGNDNGIDAIFYSPSLRQMTIVQSKWIKKGTGEPDSAEIGKFCQGIRDIFNMNFDRFNEKIARKQHLIENALNAYDTRYKIILIYTGDKGLAVHSKRQITDLLDEMNDAGEGIHEQLVEFEKFNQGKIYSSLAMNSRSQPVDLEIGLSQWGKITEPHVAFYGIVAGGEIADWWRTYGTSLFDRNLRQFLGKTDVNEEIRGTLSRAPQNFWYYNNGITIIANKIDKNFLGGGNRDVGSFKLSGASIVNGAQTVSAIGSYAESLLGSLNEVSVHVRIISLSDDDTFGPEVTRTNNRQNRIENRDFASQDSQQIRLKTELAIDGLHYNLVRSESFRPSNTSFDLQEATIALACCSEHVNLAVQAKREIGKFYENTSRGIYKTIFNPQTTGVYAYNCVQVVRFVEESLRVKIDDLPKRSGRFYGLLVHGNRIVTFLLSQQMGAISKVEVEEFSNEKKTDLSAKINCIIDDLFEILEQDYKENMLGTLFKNMTKCQSLVTKVLDKHSMI